MAERSRIHTNALIAIALAALTAALYAQVGSFDYVNYDDPFYVQENLIVQRGLTAYGVKWAFMTTTLGNWHPLTWLSYMLDCRLFGAGPGAHHLVNVLFHALNAVLLFLVLERMTQARWRSAFVAALFALHPLHVESVAWIAERKDVLSTFFWMLTLWAYAVYAERPGPKRYLPVLVFFLAGLMAKPMLVTVPVILLLMDWWPLKRLDDARQAAPAQASADPQPREKKDRRRKAQRGQPATQDKSGRGAAPFLPLLTEKIPLAILSVVFSAVAIVTQQKSGAVVPLTQMFLGDRVGNALVSCVLYLWKTIWPSGLAVFYPLRPWPPAAVLAAALFLAAVTAGALRWGRRFPYLAFGWAWYLVTILPVIGLVKLGDAAMADRYTYVPLIGPFVALGWGACDLAARLRLPKAVLPAAACGALAACAIVTHGQIAHWRDSHSLFTRALAVTEKNYLAHSNLAVALIVDGRIEEALSHIERALAIQPRFAGAHFNRGVALARLGRGDEALPPFLKALEINPAFPDANYTVAGIYLSKGDLDRAIEHFERAIRTPEPQPKAYAGLAEAYTLKGRMDEALSYSLSALEWQPADAKLHYNIGSIYIYKGRIDEAIGHFQEAVRLSPDYSRAHNNLGSALMLRNRTDEAIDHFREAVRLDPDYGMARENLRDALAQQKKGRR
ncbi:MAG: TPR repeat-containing protein YrrB [Syntrophaceae bacterium PtaB.Bin038]|nr:MAG: TPR repeat-containing protein YrrB [Syntrophaceae bacterium PtaB.Bin038]